MARVPVEDCIDKVESPYELVLVAKERSTQLNAGIEPTTVAKPLVAPSKPKKIKEDIGASK